MFPRRFALGLRSLLLLGSSMLHLAAAPVRVLIWDERQPQQKAAYDNFIGGEIATIFEGKPEFRVASAALDDPAQGLSPAALDATDVLIWWGHVRNGEVSTESGDMIARRIESGQLSLIALHSAHWSAPFMASMNAIARQNARHTLPPSEQAGALLHESPLYQAVRTAPQYTDRLTPSALYRKPFDGPVEIVLTLPNCCFPAFRPDGKPSRIRTLLPAHPIARGLPMEFTVEQTEMYNEPFHVPPPDEVVFEEHWAGGEWFRSGSVWRLGKGRIFYFRPGHELYPVFKNPEVRRVLENAVRWMGKK